MNAVVFKLCQKEYAAPIEDVRMVIRMRDIVSIPETKDYVEGVINRRGKIIPILNLKKKLHLQDAATNPHSRIIITHFEGHTVGFMVDEVLGVIDIEAGKVTAPDDVLKDAKYLKGVLNIGDRFILLADIGSFLSSDDKNDMEALKNRVEIRKQ